MLAVSVETASKQELGGVGGLVFGFANTSDDDARGSEEGRVSVKVNGR